MDGHEPQMTTATATTTTTPMAAGVNDPQSWTLCMHIAACALGAWWLKPPHCCIYEICMRVSHGFNAIRVMLLVHCVIVVVLPMNCVKDAAGFSKFSRLHFCFFDSFYRNLLLFHGCFKHHVL